MRDRQGGFIGATVTPTETAASGIWSLREAERYQRAGTWSRLSVPLLLRFNNNFNNAGTESITVNTNNVSSSSGQSKFGGYSAYFSGSNSYINFGGHPSLAFGTGDFTLEMWVWFSSTAACNLWDGRSEGVVSTFPVISVFQNKIQWDPNGIAGIVGPTVSTSQWYHVAVARSSGVARLFVDGTQYGGDLSDTNDYSNDATGPVIGIYKPALVAAFSGYIDEVRITQGHARYVGNFSAPTTEFPAP